MKRFLTYLLLLIVTSVPTVDVVVLDNSHSEASEIHAQSDIDFDKLAVGCGTHCSSCEIFHHMCDGSLALTPMPLLIGAKLLPPSADGTKNTDPGPPVPPPLV